MKSFYSIVTKYVYGGVNGLYFMINNALKYARHTEAQSPRISNSGAAGITSFALKYE